MTTEDDNYALFMYPHIVLGYMFPCKKHMYFLHEVGSFSILNKAESLKKNEVPLKSQFTENTLNSQICPRGSSSSILQQLMFFFFFQGCVFKCDALHSNSPI